MADFQHQQATCFLKGRLSRPDVIDLLPKKNSIINNDIKQLDLSELDYVDSSGVAFLFDLVEANQRKGRQIALINPSKQLQPLIALYNLQTFFSKS